MEYLQLMMLDLLSLTMSRESMEFFTLNRGGFFTTANTSSMQNVLDLLLGCLHCFGGFEAGGFAQAACGWQTSSEHKGNGRTALGPLQVYT